MTTVNSASNGWHNRQWDNEESTAAILKRDTGTDIHGNDKTWRETKTEQQSHVGFGWSGIIHSHQEADAQTEAIVHDQAHVALAGALDLPASCKDKAFTDRADTPRGANSAAAKMTEKIMKDPAGLAVLQAHCDRGVMSAYATIPSPIPNGMTLDKFLESRPQLKQICDEDAAFKVGFESYWNAGAADRKALLDNVNKHDLRSGNGVHIGG